MTSMFEYTWTRLAFQNSIKKMVAKAKSSCEAPVVEIQRAAERWDGSSVRRLLSRMLLM